MRSPSCLSSALVQHIKIAAVRIELRRNGKYVKHVFAIIIIAFTRDYDTEGGDGGTGKSPTKIIGSFLQKKTSIFSYCGCMHYTRT